MFLSCFNRISPPKVASWPRQNAKNGQKWPPRPLQEADFGQESGCTDSGACFHRTRNPRGRGITYFRCWSRWKASEKSFCPISKYRFFGPLTRSGGCAWGLSMDARGSKTTKSTWKHGLGPQFARIWWSSDQKMSRQKIDFLPFWADFSKYRNRLSGNGERGPNGPKPQISLSPGPMEGPHCGVTTKNSVKSGPGTMGMWFSTLLGVPKKWPWSSFFSVTGTVCSQVGHSIRIRRNL